MEVLNTGREPPCRSRRTEIEVQKPTEGWDVTRQGREGIRRGTLYRDRKQGFTPVGQLAGRRVCCSWIELFTLNT